MSRTPEPGFPRCLAHGVNPKIWWVIACKSITPNSDSFRLGDHTVGQDDPESPGSDGASPYLRRTPTRRRADPPTRSPPARLYFS